MWPDYDSELNKFGHTLKCELDVLIPASNSYQQFLRYAEVRLSQPENSSQSSRVEQRKSTFLKALSFYFQISMVESDKEDLEKRLHQRSRQPSAASFDQVSFFHRHLYIGLSK